MIKNTFSSGLFIYYSYLLEYCSQNIEFPYPGVPFPLGWSQLFKLLQYLYYLLEGCSNPEKALKYIGIWYDSSTRFCTLHLYLQHKILSNGFDCGAHSVLFDRIMY